jgi:hypothetical protein
MGAGSDIVTESADIRHSNRLAAILARGIKGLARGRPVSRL